MLEDPVDGYILGFSLRPLRISAVCVEIAFLPQSSQRYAETAEK
jgi:hypothetical protein